jgi:hypothetical protein
MFSVGCVRRSRPIFREMFSNACQKNSYFVTNFIEGLYSVPEPHYQMGYGHPRRRPKVDDRSHNIPEHLTDYKIKCWNRHYDSIRILR